MVLQTTAWIGMAIRYSQQNGIVLGLAQTFDGAHPCSMCQAIKAANKQEQKKTTLVRIEKGYSSRHDRFSSVPTMG